MSIDALKQKIDANTLQVGIIGLGYVGLPLAVEFAKSSVTVTGFDLSEEKTNAINQGSSYIPDVPEAELKACVDAKHLCATTDFTLINHMDAVIICVPTPLSKSKDPDLTYVLNSVETIKKYHKKGQLIILESTTYPGTTEELIQTHFLPDLVIGKDLFFAYSPERVDPGNQTYTIKNTAKIVGGTTETCTEMAKLLYSQAIDTLVPVSSPKTAEMVKILENTFRSINIGLANELAMMCDKLDLDVWEVIDAAASKPFGFMPFYPGPGLGGHCIPIDPFYLSWKLKTLNYETRFINLAGDINSRMPQYVVSKIQSGLNQHKKSINGSKILIIGVAYKSNIDDVRESPALDIIDDLQKLGADISYHDDYVPEIKTNGLQFTNTALTTTVLQDADCVVITTHHSYINVEEVVNESSLIIDTRNATKIYKKDHIIKL